MRAQSAELEQRLIDEVEKVKRSLRAEIVPYGAYEAPGLETAHGGRSGAHPGAKARRLPRRRRSCVSSALLARGLGFARMGIGAGLWLAPRRAMAVLGFDAGNPQAMALARLAGTRDIALGAVAVATADDREKASKVLRLNAVVDAGDALTFAIPLVRREGLDRAALAGGAGGRW